MARPTKRTPEARARICAAVKLGATFEHAAAAGSVSYDTLNRWMAAEPEFGEAVKRAEGEGALVCLAKIQKAATDGDWRAAAFILERRFPREYGRMGVVEQQHSGAVKIEIEYVNDWRKFGKPSVVVEAGRTGDEDEYEQP